MKLHAPVSDLVLERFPNGDVTQWFGENPALYARFGMLYHNGIDIVRPHGSPMYAVEEATVVQVNNDPSGFGKHIRLISTKPDRDGLYREWVYAHADKQHVKLNDIVFEGQHIADMGNTGFVTSSVDFWSGVNPYAGTHLHIGVRMLKLGVRGGWTYPDTNITGIEVVNYANGVRGAINPLRLLGNTYTSDNVRMYEQLQGVQKIIHGIKAFLSR
jgi:murein DD-endopeptidase MepM/ murein hydrolase activator NlpD